jgi:1,4-dihydroxy-2-naphthoate octaprenyltransferase
MEFITLAKGDAEFDQYLRGTFSRTHRALPIETYHAQTARERVTFHVVAVRDLKIPSWWKVYFWSVRPELLGLTMGPAIAAWLDGRQWMQEWNRWPSWLALLGVFFLHTAMCVLSDVQDHLRGLDRVNRRQGSQVIQKGWVSARQMQRWAYLNFALAALFGGPALFHAPAQLAVVCALALLCMVAVLLNRWARWGVSDLALALLFGPLLTSGIALASFGTCQWRDVVLGVAFGGLTAWSLQFRQFENIFRSRPEGFRTFLTAWDFDRAKVICLTEGVILLLLQPVVALYLAIPLKLWVLLPLVSVPMILTLGRLLKSASPLSSSLTDSGWWALASHSAWMVWWIVALGMAWL